MKWLHFCLKDIRVGAYLTEIAEIERKAQGYLEQRSNEILITDEEFGAFQEVLFVEQKNNNNLLDNYIGKDLNILFNDHESGRDTIL